MIFACLPPWMVPSCYCLDGITLSGTVNLTKVSRLSAAEFHRQAAQRLERVGEPGLIPLHDGRGDDGPGDDHIAGAQALAMRRKRARHMLHDADHLADELLDVLLFRSQSASPENMAHQPVELRARAGGIGWAEDDVAVEDVAGERDLHIIRRRVQVSQLDGGTERRDGCG